MFTHSAFVVGLNDKRRITKAWLAWNSSTTWHDFGAMESGFKRWFILLSYLKAQKRKLEGRKNKLTVYPSFIAHAERRERERRKYFLVKRLDRPFVGMPN